MDFEEILKSVGDNGPFQKKIYYLILIPFSMMIPWAYSSTMFMTSAPKHWCYVPELNNYSSEIQMIISSPQYSLYNQKEASYCKMFKANYSLLLNEFNLNITTNNNSKLKNDVKKYFTENKIDTIKCNQGWVYDDTDFDETAATYFDLVCDKEYLNDNVLSICGIGAIIGTPLFGTLSDKLGRKKIIFYTNIIFLIGSFSPTFIKDYNFFLVSRFLIFCVVNTLFQTPFILVNELVGPEHRAKIGCASNFLWGLGTSIIPIFAYLLRNWVYLNYVITMTGVIFIILYFWMPESPRWLIIKKRYKEAEETLKAVAKENKIKNLNEIELYQKLKLVGKKNSSTKDVENESCWVLFTNKKIFKLFIIITFGYVSNALAYNAMNMNTFSLSGNQFLNFFLLTAAELPAAVLVYYLMETRLGRRWTSSSTLFLFSISYLFTLLVSDPFWIISISILSKLLVSISFTAIYQISIEVMPTLLRNQGLSISSTVASLQSIILPYYIKRNQSSNNITIMLIVTILCLFSSIMISFIPETLNENLPQTVEDAEVFGQDKPFWCLAKKNIKKNVDADSKL